MNKIEINIPEGFEIDNEKSSLSKGIIEFKPVEKKKLSYEDIADKLFTGKIVYWDDKYGYINSNCLTNKKDKVNPNNATSKEQLECLMAYNKLRNVAEYLNKEWKANYKDSSPKYFIYYAQSTNSFEISFTTHWFSSNIHFASKELAQTAIEILGEEEIKKALFIY